MYRKTLKAFVEWSYHAHHQEPDIKRCRHVRVRSTGSLVTTMNLCIIALAFIATLPRSYCSSIDEWRRWKLNYEKVYQTEEEDSFRMRIWQQNYKLIQKHNSANLSYKLELNHFADLVSPCAWYSFLMLKCACENLQTDKEFRLTYLANEIDLSNQHNQSWLHETMLQNVPSSINWVKKGYVTEVGACH